MGLFVSFMDEDVPSLVFDNGTSECRAGFAGEDHPGVVVPSLVGRTRPGGFREKNTFVGSDAQELRSVLNLTSPLENGVITHWEEMEMIWDYAITNGLHWDPSILPVLHTDAPLTPLSVRERVAEIMFETFNVPGFCICNQAMLSMYATGRTTGLVFHSGEGASHSVPFYEGCALEYAIQTLDVNGKDLTDYMGRLLTQRGYSFSTTAERSAIQRVKEQWGYVAVDFDDEMRTATQTKALHKTYELPDGQEIELSAERFQFAEALFAPWEINAMSRGIPELLYNSIMKSDRILLPDLYCNVVVSGGNSHIPGLVERVRRELFNLAPSSMRVMVVHSRERYSSWVGGSIYGSLSFFPDASASKYEYTECGSALIRRKFAL